MSKHQKTLVRLQTKPTPPDIKWSELKSMLESLGYKAINGSGSRCKFYHEEKSALISCHRPHPQPNVDKGCITGVVDHLTAYGFIKRK